MKEVTENTERLDLKIYLCVLFLMTFGCVMVSSASTVALGKKQMLFCVLGCLMLLFFSLYDYRKLKKYAWPGYVVSIILFFMLKIPAISVTSNDGSGATRWIRLPFFNLQVAEVAKICTIIFVAAFLNRHVRILGRVKTVLWLWFFISVLAAQALIISSNLSSALILLMLAYFLTLIYSATPRLHGIMMLMAILGITILAGYIGSHMPEPAELEDWPYMLRRVAVWLDPERYAKKYGYQVMLSLYGIGSGGLTGKGLGNGINKLNIPEAQNDIILAVIGEELGIFGTMGLTLLYMYFVYLMVKVSYNVNDLFGKILSSGVFIHIGMQAILNMAVVTGVVPNTGISLPFISYGGSSILFLSMEVGMVISVFRYGIFGRRRYMEHTGRENAVNDTLKKIQQMVDTVKTDEEVSLHYMKV